MNKTNIFFLCQRWTSGGIESVINNIINYSDKEKYKFEIVASQKETNIFDSNLKNNNVNFIQLNDGFEKNPIIRNIKSFKKIKLYLKEKQPDVVHINIYNAISCIYARIAKRYNVKKIILHAHNNGFDNDKLKIKLLLNQMSKFLFYDKTYTYIACSKEAAEFCFNKKALKDCKIIENGINVSEFCYDENTRNEYRKKLNLDNCFVVGNVGRFVKQKNQLRLIDIFYSIKKIKENVKLILIGDGVLEEAIKESIERKKLKKDVLILKNRNDVNKIMQAMDCFIFPSLYEGYGIVAIEAQASGLPTYISDNLSESIFASNKSFKIDLKKEDEDIANFIISKSLQEKRKSPKMEKYEIKTMVDKINKIYTF